MTLERFCTGVLAVMPRQLVGPCETPTTAFPGAFVRLLSCVGSFVGLEVGTLGVDFVTTREVTLVDFSTLDNGSVIQKALSRRTGDCKGGSDLSLPRNDFREDVD
jgi:hypothetical protein